MLKIINALQKMLLLIQISPSITVTELGACKSFIQNCFVKLLQALNSVTVKDAEICIRTFFLK